MLQNARREHTWKARILASGGDGEQTSVGVHSRVAELGDLGVASLVADVKGGGSAADEEMQGKIVVLGAQVGIGGDSTAAESPLPLVPGRNGGLPSPDEALPG